MVVNLSELTVIREREMNVNYFRCMTKKYQQIIVSSIKGTVLCCSKISLKLSKLGLIISEQVEAQVKQLYSRSSNLSWKFAEIWTCLSW